MITKRIAFLFTILMASCGANETVRNYGGGDKVWALKSINETPVKTTITLQFPDEGGIIGQAPCNSYFATMTAPYPWFKVGPIGATRMACDDLDKEADYFEMLEKMQQVEVLGNTLVLTDGAKLELVFKAD